MSSSQNELKDPLYHFLEWSQPDGREIPRPTYMPAKKGKAILFLAST